MNKLFKNHSNLAKIICVIICGAFCFTGLLYTMGIVLNERPVEPHELSKAPDDNKLQQINTPVLETNSPLMERHVEEIERGTVVCTDKSLEKEQCNELPGTFGDAPTDTAGADENTSDNSVESEDSPGKVDEDSVSAVYVGHLDIPSVGISVNCYGSSAQAVVDASNSAAYYYGYGHTVIADHVNQSFAGLRRCVVGTRAYFAASRGTTEYTCVAVIEGHNTGYELTDANYNSIKNLYPGTIVCYTCNGNWQNTIMVFWGIPGSDTGSAGAEDDADSEFYVNEDKVICSAGTHSWELVDTFVYWDIEDGYRIKYSREHSVCSVCESDWLRTEEIERMTEEEYWEKNTVVETPTPTPPPTESAQEPHEEETEPVETEPVETEPVEAEPVETEPVETEPAETEPAETEPIEMMPSK